MSSNSESLPIMSHNSNNWMMESERRPAVLIFTADWSGSTEILKGFMEKILKEHADLYVEWINVDDYPELAEDYGVNQVPTIVIVRHREVVDHIAGLLPRRQLANKILSFTD